MEWISVEDRLPDNLQGILCINEFGGQWVDQYYEGFPDEQPTHWMPLPGPPKI